MQGFQSNNAMDWESLAADIVDAAYHVHLRLGPGLLESVYQAVLAHELLRRGHHVKCQVSVPFVVDEVIFEDGLRVDLLVDYCFIIELKSAEKLQPVHYKQLLTYLRLSNQPLGLLINFGAPTFKEGVRRLMNQHYREESSREDTKKSKEK